MVKLLKIKNKLLLALLFITIIPSKLISNRIVGYYPSWVQNQYPIGSVDFSTFSHLIHAFAWPNNQGEIISDIGTFNSNFASQVQSQGSKFLLAIGGWGTAAGFVASTATHEIRSYFISNIIDIVDQYGYDGIDIDWEYPQTNEQRNNLNLFISELDSTLNIHNPDLILSMAVPISNWAGQWYDFFTLNQHIDFFNAMTYDIHGSWSNDAGHNSPLHPSPPGDIDGSVSTGINYLVNTRGIPNSKINMGIPFWGKKYTTSEINGSFTGNVVDMRYYEIIGLINDGWSYNWDEVAKCPYLIKDDQSKIITYDNPLSIQYKCQYANEMNLGGLMVWALGYDDHLSTESLSQSINDSWLYSDKKWKFPLSNNYNLSAYPNPFNSYTIINFDVPNKQYFSVDVYDINGKFNENIFDGIINQGSQNIKWKTKQNKSNGVYIIQLSTLESKISKKVIFLK